MKKKRKQSKDCVAVVSVVGQTVFLCLYPFFLHDRYFKMTIGKTVFFCCASGLFALACVIAWLCSRPRPSVALIRRDYNELFFGLFLFTAALSCAASIDPAASFTGSEGRYMGMATLLFIALAYAFIARFGRFTQTVAVIFGVSLVLMNVISFLQYCGLDPLGLYVGTAPSVRVNFLSLVGNRDVYYSYLALAVPFAMFLSFRAKELKESIFRHAVVFFGFLGVFACNSEGAYIGILPAFVILFFLFCREKQGMLTFLLDLILFFAAAVPVGLITKGLEEYNISQSVFIKEILRPWVCLIAVAVLAACWFVIYKVYCAPAFFKAIRIAAAVALGAAAICVCAAFIHFTFVDKTTDIGSFAELLRFDRLYWGNKRGFIWSKLWGLFRDAPLYRKMIGFGEETVRLLTNRNFYDEMIAKTGMNFDNAHNEFLQYLITQGALGLLSYLLFAGSAIRKGFRQGGLQAAAALSCVCYMVQSAVNISQAITTPLFFVFLALTQTADADQSGNNASVGDVSKKKIKVREHK